MDEKLIENIENYLNRKCLIIFDKFLIRQKIIFDHIEQFKNLQSQQKVCIILDSGSFDINGAFDCLDYCKEREIAYDAIVLNKLASAGTIMALGAENLFFTRQGALGVIDPTHYFHDFPKIYFRRGINTIVRRVNLDEINCYKNFIRESLSEDKQAIAEVLAPLHAALDGCLIEQAQTRLLFIQKELQKLFIKNHPNCDYSYLSEFMTVGSGSFDYTLHQSELKKLNLSINSCSPFLEELLYPIYMKFHG